MAGRDSRDSNTRDRGKSRDDRSDSDHDDDDRNKNDNDDEKDEDDNQSVRRGQLLAVIDSADARSRLSQIDAQRVQADTQILQAEATEKGAAAQADAASRDVARYNLLMRTAPNAVAQQQVDQAVATARNAAAQRDAARAQIAGARAQLKVLAAQRTQVDLNLGYTRITAPVDGHIAQRTVAAGNYVSPGQELMTIVPLNLWVTANFKETQLALMRVGQSVEVEVDACDHTLKGHVQSIQRGAGHLVFPRPFLQSHPQ